VVDQILAGLECSLRSLSHSDDAIRAVQDFCEKLDGTKARIALWNSVNAIVQSPIEPRTVNALGFNTPDDEFVLLQGDLVRTESAFFLGERITGHPKYAVLNSSCDLVPGRASYSSLLRIVEIRRRDPEAKAKLGQLLKFTRRDSMYLPPLPDDREEVIGNAIQFEGPCQIQTGNLLLANRLASLSLVGWRIFASFARIVVARANPREVEIRTAIEKQSNG
jgi:hypothetical protein